MSMQYFISCITQNYVGFGGRARRAEYWYFTLFVSIISYGIIFVDAAVGASGILAFFVGLGFFLPNLAVSVRRLHDTDRSGWWLLILFLPLIGAIVVFVFYVLRGTAGENRFGPDPISEEGAYDEVFK